MLNSYRWSLLNGCWYHQRWSRRPSPLWPRSLAALPGKVLGGSVGAIRHSAQDGATGGLCSEGTRETRLESTGQGCWKNLFPDVECHAEEPGEIRRISRKIDKNMVTFLQKTLISPAQVMTLPCPVSWFRAEESKIEQVLAERLDLTPGNLREGLRCATAGWDRSALAFPERSLAEKSHLFFLDEKFVRVPLMQKVWHRLKWNILIWTKEFPRAIFYWQSLRVERFRDGFPEGISICASRGGFWMFAWWLILVSCNRMLFGKQHVSHVT